MRLLPSGCPLTTLRSREAQEQDVSPRALSVGHRWALDISLSLSSDKPSNAVGEGRQGLPAFEALLAWGAPGPTAESEVKNQHPPGRDVEAASVCCNMVARAILILCNL